MGPLLSAGRYIQKHKKGFIGGGVGAGVGGLLVAGFFALLPLKLIHLKETFFRHNFSVQEMNERNRGYHLMRRILLKGKFNADGKYKITTQGFVSRRMTEYKLDRLERKMERRGKYQLEYDPVNGGLREIYRLEGGKKIPIGLKALDQTARTSALYTAIDEVVPHWRIGKRIKYRVLMTQRTGLPWRFFRRNDTTADDADRRSFYQRMDDYIRGRSPAGLDAGARRTPGQNETAEQQQQAQQELDGQAGEFEGVGDAVIEEVSSGNAPNVDAAIAGSNIKGRIFRGIGLTGFAAAICGVVDLLTNVSDNVVQVRMANLMRSGNLLLVTASHVKDGSLDPNDLNDMMTKLDGYETITATDGSERRVYAGAETAAAYKVASGEPLTEFDRSERDLSPDAHPSKAAIGGIANTLNSIINTIPGGGLACNILTNVVGQIVLTIGEGIVAIFSGGSSAVAAVAVSEVGQEILARTALPIIIKFVTNLSVSAAVNAVDLTNNMDAGLNLSASEYARNLGANDMTTAEFEATHETARKVAASEFQQQSFAYRWFNSEDPNSLASRLAIKLPSTKQAMVARLVALPQTILRSVASMLFNVRPVYAEGKNPNEFGAERRYKFKQYGFTEAEIAAYEGPENELYQMQSIPIAPPNDCPSGSSPVVITSAIRFDVMQNGYDYHCARPNGSVAGSPKHVEGYGESCFDMTRPDSRPLDTDGEDHCKSLGKSPNHKLAAQVVNITNADIRAHLYCPGKNGNCPETTERPHYNNGDIVDTYSAGKPGAELLSYRIYRLDRHIVCNQETDNTEAEPSDGCPRFAAGGGSQTPAAATVPGGSNQHLAQQILDNDNISLSGGAGKTINLLAAGATTVPAGNGTQVAVSPALLGMLLKMGQDGVKFTATSITTGGHSATSLHFDGRAVDLVGDFSRIMTYLYSNRAVFKIDELFYDSPPGGVTNLDRGQPSGPIGGHSDHIHVGIQ